MTSTDHLIHTTAHIAEEMSTDRETGHRMTMSLFPHTTDPAARSTWNVLWTVLSGSTVLVRTTYTGTLHLPDWVKQYDHHPTTEHTTGEHVTFTVELAALHTILKTGADGTPRPPGQGKSYRANKTPVPHNELNQWLPTKLTRHGLNTEHIDIQWYRTIRLPAHNDSLPITRIHTTATITNATTPTTANNTPTTPAKEKGAGAWIGDIDLAC